MGICWSENSEAYHALRTSLPGSLITSDSDYYEFYKNCRVETHTISNTLNINSIQSFYVVVSGEIVVCITPKDGKSVVVSTFRPGEMIYFFHGNSISCSGGAINNKNLRLNLQYRSSKDGIAQVIGMDRGTAERFFDEKPHLTELKRLLELQLLQFIDLPAFASLNKEQLNFLGPLMKLRLTNAGEIIRHPGYGFDDRGGQLAADKATNLPMMVTTPSSIKGGNQRALPALAPKPLGVLLTGTCFTLPVSASSDSRKVVNEFLVGMGKKRLPANGTSLLLNDSRDNSRDDVSPLNGSAVVVVSPGGNTSTAHPQPGSAANNNNNNNNNNKTVNTRSSLYSAANSSSLPSTTHHLHQQQQQQQTVLQQKQRLKALSEASSRLGMTENDRHVSQLIEKLGVAMHLAIEQVLPGSVFGLDDCFIKNFDAKTEPIVSAGRNLVGYIELETLRVLFQLDRRIKRVLQRNFMASMLQIVRPQVPMLCDMDLTSIELLSSMVTMRYYHRHDVLYCRGLPSDYCFLLVSGCLRERPASTAASTAAALPVRSLVAEELPEGEGEGQGEGSKANLRGQQQQPQQEEKSVALRNNQTTAAAAAGTADGEGVVVIYRGGSLVGELALITDSPYFTTLTAEDASTVICISKRVFDRIYYGNKSKFAEFSIRLTAQAVELPHILHFKPANDLFLAHLVEERAEENILFLNVVDKFHDMCDRLRRDLSWLLSMQQQHQTSTMLATAEDSSQQQQQQQQQPGNTAAMTISNLLAHQMIPLHGHGHGRRDQTGIGGPGTGSGTGAVGGADSGYYPSQRPAASLYISPLVMNSIHPAANNHSLASPMNRSLHSRLSSAVNSSSQDGDLMSEVSNNHSGVLLINSALPSRLPSESGGGYETRRSSLEPPSSQGQGQGQGQLLQGDDGLLREEGPGEVAALIAGGQGQIGEGEAKEKEGEGDGEGAMALLATSSETAAAAAVSDRQAAAMIYHSPYDYHYDEADDHCLVSFQQEDFLLGAGPGAGGGQLLTQLAEEDHDDEVYESSQQTESIMTGMAAGPGSGSSLGEVGGGGTGGMGGGGTGGDMRSSATISSLQHQLNDDSMQLDDDDDLVISSDRFLPQRIPSFASLGKTSAATGGQQTAAPQQTRRGGGPAGGGPGGGGNNNESNSSLATTTAATTPTTASTTSLRIGMGGGTIGGGSHSYHSSGKAIGGGGGGGNGSGNGSENNNNSYRHRSLRVASEPLPAVLEEDPALLLQQQTSGQTPTGSSSHHAPPPLPSLSAAALPLMTAAGNSVQNPLAAAANQDRGGGGMSEQKERNQEEQQAIMSRAATREKDEETSSVRSRQEDFQKLRAMLSVTILPLDEASNKTDVTGSEGLVVIQQQGQGQGQGLTAAASNNSSSGGSGLPVASSTLLASPSKQPRQVLRHTPSRQQRGGGGGGVQQMVMRQTPSRASHSSISAGTFTLQAHSSNQQQPTPGSPPPVLVSAAALSQLSLKLESSLGQLRLVAATIIKKFIENDAASQVNLPDKMQKKVLQCQEKWQLSCDLVSLQEMLQQGLVKMQRQQQLQAAVASSPTQQPHELLDCDYLHIFDEAYVEISKLLRTGPFPRWKQCEGFKLFLASLKPYEVSSATASASAVGAAAGSTGMMHHHHQHAAAAVSTADYSISLIRPQLRGGTGGVPNINNNNHNNNKSRSDATIASTAIQPPGLRPDSHAVFIYNGSSDSQNPVSTAQRPQQQRALSPQNSSASFNMYVVSSTRQVNSVLQQQQQQQLQSTKRSPRAAFKPTTKPSSSATMSGLSRQASYNAAMGTAAAASGVDSPGSGPVNHAAGVSGSNKKLSTVGVSG